MRTLMSGLGLVESPRWHDGRLWFSDWINGQIHAVDDAGRSEVVITHQSLPLCFDFLPAGPPIMVSNSRSALLAVDHDRSLSQYADLSHVGVGGGNDIVIDGRGTVYVNNPGYDVTSGPPPASNPSPGVVAMVRAGSDTAVVVADDLAFPNGMAVTPDGATLIVAESHRCRLTAFDIGDDSALSGRRLWADLGEDAPDGVCVDASGALWYADVPHQRCVRVREGGAVLQTVDVDRGAFACMLGGGDPPALYIVAARWPGMAAIATSSEWDGCVLAETVTVAGAGWPART